MRQCSNCGTQISCGCQDRIASNGVMVCASCISSYEQQLLFLQAQSIINQDITGKDEKLLT